MCDYANCRETIAELVSYLANADYNLREELVLKVREGWRCTRARGQSVRCGQTVSLHTVRCGLLVSQSDAPPMRRARVCLLARHARHTHCSVAARQPARSPALAHAFPCPRCHRDAACDRHPSQIAILAERFADDYAWCAHTRCPLPSARSTRPRRASSRDVISPLRDITAPSRHRRYVTAATPPRAGTSTWCCS